MSPVIYLSIICRAVSHFGGAFGNGVKAFQRRHNFTTAKYFHLQSAFGHFTNMFGQVIGAGARPGKFFGQVVAMRHLILVCTPERIVFFSSSGLLQEAAKTAAPANHRQGIFFVSWFLFSWIFLGKNYTMAFRTEVDYNPILWKIPKTI